MGPTNYPKQPKTTQNNPKQPKTTQNKPKTNPKQTQNKPKTTQDNIFTITSNQIRLQKYTVKIFFSPKNNAGKIKK